MNIIVAVFYYWVPEMNTFIMCKWAWQCKKKQNRGKSLCCSVSIIYWWTKVVWYGWLSQYVLLIQLIKFFSVKVWKQSSGLWHITYLSNYHHDFYWPSCVFVCICLLRREWSPREDHPPYPPPPHCYPSPSFHHHHPQYERGPPPYRQRQRHEQGHEWSSNVDGRVSEHEEEQNRRCSNTG